jgi:hypothetical protein
MINNNVREFLWDFHGEEETYFRCIKDKSIKDYHGRYDERAQQELEKLNQQNYEIYFVPNSGGYSGDTITRFNCVFVDLDKGRDNEGEYYDLEEVALYKQAKLSEINNFELKPSYIIETRNGFHIYWLLEDGSTLEQFSECEERLISYFDGDLVVKNPARLLRLPSYYWNKDPKNKFMVRIIQVSGSRYDISSIITHLPEPTPSEKGVNNRKKYKELLSTDDTKSSFTTLGDNLINLKNKNIEAIQSIIKPKGATLNSHDEVYDYLKKQDLRELLGLHGKTFNCIFHEDKKPSAGILINEDTGHYIYNCMSSNCGVSLTIIQVVERLTKLNRVESLRFLRKLYKLDYQETDWQKEKKEILQENQRLIMSSELSLVYPEIDRMIRSSVNELLFMNQLALNHLQTEYFSDKQGNPIFFSSLRHIAHLCGKDARRLSDKISLFAYLGLIRKVPETEIPDKILSKAKQEAAKKKQHHLVSFYSISSYDEETFQFTKAKIKEYKELGFTMRGWGRELLLRTLGEEECNRVFPQMSGKKIPEQNHEMTSHIEHMALWLINHKGFTTEQEILFNLVQNYGKKSLYEKQIKRIVPDLLSKYGLCKRRLNKELKEQLIIEDMVGYPTILYK